MAKSKDHKAQKAKARKEALRKQKAQVAAQPRLLRQYPGLDDALSTRHPLLGYYVNKDWAEHGVAAIHVIRQADTGEVFGSFLVDLYWKGVKDAYGSHGETDVLGRLNESLRRREAETGEPPPEIVPIAPEAAVNLIRGGIVWARRWKFPLPEELSLWLRLVDPAPAWGLDLGMFGSDGERPIIMGTAAEIDRWIRRNPDIATLDDLDKAEAYDEEDEDEEAADIAFEALEALGLWQPPTQPDRLWVPGVGIAEPDEAEPGLYEDWEDEEIVPSTATEALEAPGLLLPPAQPVRLWLPPGSTPEAVDTTDAGSTAEADGTAEKETSQPFRLWLPGRDRQ